MKIQLGIDFAQFINTRAACLLLPVLAVACQNNEQSMNITQMTAYRDSTSSFSDVTGRGLFETATFDGNGRSCSSCHQGDLRSITPEQARALFASNPEDPLFSHDAADNFGTDDENCVPVSLDLACSLTGWNEICHIDTVGSVVRECRIGFRRFLTHATIRVPIDLHENVNVLGEGRQVFVNRGIPTTVDIALEPVLMEDGRAPDLEAQAADALQGHAQAQQFTEEHLAAIASFEASEFSRPELAAYAAGGAAPALPAGRSESEKRGRGFFVQPETTGKEGFCGICHAGPMLNEMGVDIVVPGVSGNTPGLEAAVNDRFITALVSEVNLIGNPLKVWQINNDGIPIAIVSPDIGLAAITGRWSDVNKFKIPSLWGSHERAPFFHDNSAKTVEEMIDHYANFTAPTFRVVLTPQDKADIAAYLKLL